MNERKFREICCTIMLIAKDLLMTLTNSLIATILISICMENGWFFYKNITDISHDMFWDLYSIICILIPFILFNRGLKGKYIVEAKKIHVETPLNKAKLKERG